ncbi:MAG: hypothetical protein M1820_010131 [Bogoriella megaspora]|nr:MAG: hypothetical protein M1820_010131 [Bogoriella megaspora]
MLPTLVFAFFALTSVATAAHAPRVPSKSAIRAAAKADGIDLDILPFAERALDSIQAIATPVPQPENNGTKVDVHIHINPDWYHQIAPVAGQNPTPNWTLPGHLQFMANEGTRKSVISISTPGTVVYVGDEAKSAALARLLNEYMAALQTVYPQRFAFYAATPLPYVNASITEARYAVEKLGATGVGLLTNHEGYYLGNTTFFPFFEAVNSFGKHKNIIFVHATDPCLHASNGSLISANPSTFTSIHSTSSPLLVPAEADPSIVAAYAAGLIEFYFETARTLRDVTLSGTLLNFTSLHWVAAQIGGSFPSIIDRFITRETSDFQNAAKTAYRQRIWWESAGTTYLDQVQGLLAYGVPKTQLLFGTDYPYAPVPEVVYQSYAGEIQNATFLTEAEKQGVFSTNARNLFGPI